MNKTLYNSYWDRGWTVVPEVFSADEIEAICRLSMAIAIAEIADGEGDDADLDVDEQGRPIPRKIMFPFTKDSSFARFALSKRLRQLLEEVVGKPMYLAFDQVFLKPPRHGSAKPYHQDNAYFQCRPGDEVITAWIALDDVDEANGCLRYVSGSHKLPVLEHHETEGQRYNLQPDASDIDLTNESLAPVQRGGVVLHHSHTLHTSHANTSDRWRRAYATHWVSGDVVSDIDTVERAYFAKYADRYSELLGGD
ncbi:MAG: phytanoyl-CoA dioxygenase family protein [Rhodothermales bacterium]|nr:phytanoyl-CoA dioxygenase family protein [Rhodothermales bacterium]